MVMPEDAIGTINDGAFEGCTSLKKLTLYEVYQGFKGSPFRGWTNEQEVYFDWYEAADIDWYFMFYPQYLPNLGDAYRHWFDDTNALYVGSDGLILVDKDGTVVDPNATEEEAGE